MRPTLLFKCSYISISVLNALSVTSICNYSQCKCSKNVPNSRTTKILMKFPGYFHSKKKSSMLGCTEISTIFYQRPRPGYITAFPIELSLLSWLTMSVSMTNRKQRDYFVRHAFSIQHSCHYLLSLSNIIILHLLHD